MNVPLILPLSITLGLLVWGLAFRWYIAPVLSPLPIERALRPLLLLHATRYVGLMFLVPGVTSGSLDPRFVEPAAYGDLLAAVLALATIVAFRAGRRAGLAAAWLFNLWGLLDLLNAVGRGLAYVPGGMLGATFWIPAVAVPLLLVSHGYIFVRLVAEVRPAGRVPHGAGA